MGMKVTWTDGGIITEIDGEKVAYVPAPQAWADLKALKKAGAEAGYPQFRRIGEDPEPANSPPKDGHWYRWDDGLWVHANRNDYLPREDYDGPPPAAPERVEEAAKYLEQIIARYPGSVGPGARDDLIKVVQMLRNQNTMDAPESAAEAPSERLPEPWASMELKRDPVTDQINAAVKAAVDPLKKESAEHRDRINGVIQERATMNLSGRVRRIETILAALIGHKPPAKYEGVDPKTFSVYRLHDYEDCRAAKQGREELAGKVNSRLTDAENAIRFIQVCLGGDDRSADLIDVGALKAQVGGMQDAIGNIRVDALAAKNAVAVKQEPKPVPPGGGPTLPPRLSVAATPEEAEGIVEWAVECVKGWNGWAEAAGDWAEEMRLCYHRRFDKTDTRLHALDKAIRAVEPLAARVKSLEGDLAAFAEHDGKQRGIIQDQLDALNAADAAVDAADPAGEPSGGGVRTWMSQHRDEVERRMKGIGDKVVGLESRVSAAEGRAETAVGMARKALSKVNGPEQDANAAALNMRLGNDAGRIAEAAGSAKRAAAKAAGIDADPHLPADSVEVGLDDVAKPGANPGSAIGAELSGQPMATSDTKAQTRAAVESIDKVLADHRREERAVRLMEADASLHGEYPTGD